MGSEYAKITYAVDHGSAPDPLGKFTALCRHKNSFLLVDNYVLNDA